VVVVIHPVEEEDEVVVEADEVKMVGLPVLFLGIKLVICYLGL
jgi:hypothetical protein